MQSAGGGGKGLSRLGGGGLARFRSAPATWLEALLETEEENDDVLDPPILTSSSSSTTTTNKPPLHPPTVSSGSTQPSSASSGYAADLGLLDSVGSGGGGLTGLLRQNSSPAEFFSDGYFSSFGIPANYDFLMSSSPLDASESSPKRPREGDSENLPAKASSPAVKGEQSGQFHSGLLDAEMDKLSEDAVLCRVRAKRGCATHPRSIAERVRRTRISDRIRKLQELVPNMDKMLLVHDGLEFPWKAIWRSKAPQNVAFFVWTAALGKILIADNLRRRGLVVVSRCYICKKDGESVDHLLLHCDVARSLWD